MPILTRPAKHTVFAILMSASASLSYAEHHDAPEKVWSLEGFNEPESVLAHPSQDLIYVSNINGTPVEKNGKGYISLVSSQGEMLKKHWTTGLDAPKGLGVFGDYLYVADMQTLHIIDQKTGELLESISHPDSVMLNDIAIDNTGTVYISDLLGGGIYRYNAKHNKTLTQWISPKQLPHPNGLFYRANSQELQLATWGKGLQEDFSTTTLGGLYRINLNNKAITPYKNAQTFGNLDGITRMGDNWIVNDWMTGDVFSYNNATVKTLFNAGKHAADISSKGDFLFVPVMFEKRVDVYRLQ
jgi:DNA-binding beta-propeller fold protein YncE